MIESFPVVPIRSLACLLVILLAGPVVAEDWPQFRGAHRDGSSSETGLIDRIPEDGLPLVFDVPLGRGFSEIVVAGDRLFTMFSTGEGEAAREHLVARDARDGKEIWRLELGPEFVDEFGNGPRSTPSVDGDRVYALAAKGVFVCAAVSDGKILWQVDLPAEFGAAVPRWGFTCSPLVDGKRVVLEVGGGEKNGFAAFDRTSGKPVFAAEKATPSYCSPVLIDVAGQPQYIFVRGDEIVSLTREGELLWTYPWQKNTMTIAVPLFVAPDRLLVSASGNGGATLMKVLEVEGFLDVQEVWKNRNLKNHFSMSVVSGEHVYGFDNATLRCLDLAEGGRVWAKRGFGKGSLILAEDKLWILSDRGQLVLARVSPDGFEELGRHQVLDGKCWTSPSLAGGKLYVRNMESLRCYEVSP